MIVIYVMQKKCIKYIFILIYKIVYAEGYLIEPHEWRLTHTAVTHEWSQVISWSQGSRFSLKHHMRFLLKLNQSNTHIVVKVTHIVVLVTHISSALCEPLRRKRLALAGDAIGCIEHPFQMRMRYVKILVCDEAGLSEDFVNNVEELFSTWKCNCAIFIVTLNLTTQ